MTGRGSEAMSPVLNGFTNGFDTETTNNTYSYRATALTLINEQYQKNSIHTKHNMRLKQTQNGTTTTDYYKLNRIGLSAFLCNTAKKWSGSTLKHLQPALSTD